MPYYTVSSENHDFVLEGEGELSTPKDAAKKWAGEVELDSDESGFCVVEFVASPVSHKKAPGLFHLEFEFDELTSENLKQE